MIRATRNNITQRRTSSAAFLVAPVTACAAQPTTGVPASAAAASTQIRTAVHTALASGKRRLCVDLLLAALDPRARTYDAAAAETVFGSLVGSLRAVVPEGSSVRVVVAGANAAVRTTGWAAAAGMRDVTVDVFGGGGGGGSGGGVAEEGARRRPRSRQQQLRADDVGAVLLLNPPVGAARVAETRAELVAAHAADVPIVVHNHPREDAVYESLGYRGTVSRELWTHDTAYMVAPFAIQAEGVERMRQGGRRGDGGAEVQQAPPLRFVLMRQFPGKWQLWKFGGGDGQKGDDGAGEMALDSVGSDYVLCREYEQRPSNETLFKTIKAITF